MGRSEFSRLLREAEDFIARHGVVLPPFAHWTPGEWASRPEIAAFWSRRQMSWAMGRHSSARCRT